MQRGYSRHETISHESASILRSSHELPQRSADKKATRTRTLLQLSDDDDALGRQHLLPILNHLSAMHYVSEDLWSIHDFS